MRGHLVTLLVGLSACAPAWALDASVQVEVGVRDDDFEWSIADTDGHPNVLSELRWRDLRTRQLGVTAELAPSGPLLYRVRAAYGDSYAGEVRDSDYREGGRRQEYSRSISSARGGRMTEFRLALGYPLGGRGADSVGWSLVPLAGLDYRRLDLHLRDGRQEVNSPEVPVPLGRFEGLDSWYKAEWLSPWVGIEVARRQANGVAVQLGLELHPLAQYSAEADWNLRTDLAHPVSFEHRAWGYGLVTSLGLAYQTRDRRWDLAARLSWQRWRTEDGDDDVYTADGRILRTRFNGADWRSRAISLSAIYRF